jgi:hypothetical protein
MVQCAEYLSLAHWRLRWPSGNEARSCLRDYNHQAIEIAAKVQYGRICKGRNRGRRKGNTMPFGARTR